MNAADEPGHACPTQIQPECGQSRVDNGKGIDAEYELEGVGPVGERPTRMEEGKIVEMLDHALATYFPQ